MDTLDDDLRRIWVKHSADDVVTTLQQFIAAIDQAKAGIKDIDDADECLADVYRLRASARRLIDKMRLSKDIEITPAMIEAGALRLSSYCGRDEEPSDVAPEIFRRMVSASRNQA